MTIYQSGFLNTSALVVPNTYIQVVAPPPLFNGQPSNVLGIVGTASWGAVNASTITGSGADYLAKFGPIMPRKYDAGTAVLIAQQQGCSNFRVVRQTDGTDTAASGIFQLIGMTITARYTGTYGNSIQGTLQAGRQAGTWRLIISIGNGVPQVTKPIVEVFDNIAFGLTGNAVWVAMANALNNGIGSQRGPSQIVVATAGSTSATPIATTTPVACSGGTDGVSLITSTMLIGSDVATPRTGIYALRAQGCAVGMVADMDDSTKWTTIDALGLTEGIYFFHTAPSGSALQNGTTGTVDLKTSAGLDSYGSKVIHGDWVYWTDTANQALRVVSPQAFLAGKRAVLSPQQSLLNKPLVGVVATQKSGLPGSGQQGAYADADLQVMALNGIDVIANPGAGGLSIWTARIGHNASSNQAIQNDNYTTLTNFIASSLTPGLSPFLGQVISPTLFQQVKGAIDSFLTNMWTQGILVSMDGNPPFYVECDTADNPQSRTALGYVQSDVQVIFPGINEKLLINLQGGATVQITRASQVGINS